MREISDPNWLAVAGLIYFTYGSIVLASVATADAGLSDRAQITGRRSVRSTFAILLLVVGGATLAAAQFVSVPFGPPIVFDLLALAFAILVFSLVGDSWAERVAAESSAIGRSAPFSVEFPARVEAEIPATVRLRAAG